GRDEPVPGPDAGGAASRRWFAPSPPREPARRRLPPRPPQPLPRQAGRARWTRARRDARRLPLPPARASGADPRSVTRGPDPSEEKASIRGARLQVGKRSALSWLPHSPGWTTHRRRGAFRAPAIPRWRLGFPQSPPLAAAASPGGPRESAPAYGCPGERQRHPLPRAALAPHPPKPSSARPLTPRRAAEPQAEPR